MNTAAENLNEEVDLDAELMALLAEAEDGTPAAVAAAEDEEIEVDLEQIEADAAVAEAKAEAYAEAKGDEDAEELTAAATPAPAPKTRKTKTVTILRAASPTTKLTQPSAILGSKFSRDQLLRAAYMVTGDDTLGEEEALAQMNDRLDKLAKKVGEKAVNFIQNIERPHKIQTFTTQALDALIEKGGLSNVDLAAVYARYSLGTARSQSSQIFQLLPALGIATRNGICLTLNDDNPFVASYKAAKTAAPVAAAA